MPTPSDGTIQLSPSIAEHERSNHATCPPDNGRTEVWRAQEESHISEDGPSGLPARQQSEHILAESAIVGLAENGVEQDAQLKMESLEQEQSNTDGQSPLSLTAESETRESETRLTPSPSPSIRPMIASYPTNYEFSKVRVRNPI